MTGLKYTKETKKQQPWNQTSFRNYISTYIKEKQNKQKTLSLTHTHTLEPFSQHFDRRNTLAKLMTKTKMWKICTAEIRSCVGKIVEHD